MTLKTQELALVLTGVVAGLFALNWYLCSTLKGYDPDKVTIEEEDGDEISESRICSLSERLLSASRSKLTRMTKWGVTRLDHVHFVHPLSLPPTLVLVTDLDHTLFGVGPDQTQEEVNGYIDSFNKLWTEKYAANNCVLVYATGRNFNKYMVACKQYPTLLKPDILVCADGVEIIWFNQHLAEIVQEKSQFSIDIATESGDMLRHDFVWKDKSWEARMSEGWNQAFAESLHHEGAKKFSYLPVPNHSIYLEQFRIATTVRTKKEAAELQSFYEQRVAEYNSLLEEGVSPMQVHSFHCIEGNEGGWWAAFTPAMAGKGCAVDWIRDRLHLADGERVVAAGDSGNDVSMLSLPKHHAVVVQNSGKELMQYYEAHADEKGKYIYLTESDRTRGVIEGLAFFSERIAPGLVSQQIELEEDDIEDGE